MGARRIKEEKYKELLAGDWCRTVVVGIETGCRWSLEAVEFVDMLAGASAREAPPVLRRSAYLAWRGRWRRMLAVSCARAFANSVVSRSSDTVGTDGAAPDLADLPFVFSFGLFFTLLLVFQQSQ